MPVELLCGLLCDDTIWSPVAEHLRVASTNVAIRSFAGFAAITAMAEAVLDQAPPRFALAGAFDGRARGPGGLPARVR